MTQYNPPSAPLPSKPQARPHPLIKALTKLADGHGCLRRHDQRNWASATFAGARHRMTLEFTGAQAITGADQLIALAPDHEFDLPGELVADLSICEVRHAAGPPPVLRIELEALLLAEA